MPLKPKKPLTEEEQLELDMQVEAELGRLQRQYKIMDRDRSKYGGGGKLAKQRRMIQILEREKVNLDNDLHVAMSSTKKKGDEEVSTKLLDLLEGNDYFNNHITKKKAHLHEIDTQIIKVKKDVDLIAAKQITDNEIQIRILDGQKTVECLENKLDAAVKRFCTISTENRHLREHIDHLLFERTTFNKIWEKLIRNLNRGKSFMIDLIEQSTIAYDQRDEWCSKLHALRNRAHADLLLQTHEMQELQRHLDHEKKLEEFLAIKGQRRQMMKLYEKQFQKKNETRDKMGKQLEEYKKMLEEIMKFTGFGNVQELAQFYVKQEEENFSMFNYFNVLHKEIEDLASNLVDLHIKIEQQRALNQSRAIQQAETLTKLNGDLKLATKAADSRKGDLNKTRAKLQKLYVGIEKLFKICKCSNAPFLELLGDNFKINDYNVLLYLEMLEKRITELIMSVYYKQKTASPKEKGGAINVIKEDVHPYPVHPLVSVVPTNPCPLCVEQEQVSDIIDELQFVQNKNEVTNKLALRLALPDGLNRLHNVSACHLPKSRQIIQRRYQ